MDKALDALATARHDLEANFTLAAANRSYYSMFYCMTGLLYLHDIHTKSHHDLDADVTKEEAAIVLANAETFITLTRKYLEDIKAEE